MCSKRFLKGIGLTIILYMFLMLGAISAFAAEPGSMMANAIPISFGQTYSKSWLNRSDHLNHFNKITVPKRGILTLNFTKPFDSEGEYGRLYFTLYDDSGNEVWGHNCYKAEETALDTYILKVGVKPGTYYLVVKPGFYVSSGVIETYYTINFTGTNYCEVEPNSRIADGTDIALGWLYKGYFGSGASDFEENDYWKVRLTKGYTYKISIDGYDKIESTTAILDFVDPNGEDDSYTLRSKIKNLSDSSGRNYILYTAGATGYYSLCLRNYMGRQFEYGIKVERKDKRTQSISGVPGTITKRDGDSSFIINASAQTRLSYSSSNRSVASVLSNGCVYIWGPGTTTITISAEESDIFKSAKKSVKLTVLNKNVKTKQTVTVKNKKIKLKARKLKKKGATIKSSIVTRGNRARTKISYSLVKVNKSKKSFKISKKGAIKVKKGTKKGVYKLTIKATAKGNSVYKKASKKFTVKITVK